MYWVFVIVGVTFITISGLRWHGMLEFLPPLLIGLLAVAYSFFLIAGGFQMMEWKDFPFKYRKGVSFVVLALLTTVSGITLFPLQPFSFPLC